MAESEPTQPTESSTPPFHDPWASTVSVPGPADTPPAPPTAPADTPPAPPAAPVSDPGYPPIAKYPYPGLALDYPGATGAAGPTDYPATDYPATGYPVPARGYPDTRAYPVTAPYPGTAAGAGPAYPGPDGYPAAEPVIAQIGDIQVTANTIRTPAGTFPLQGSQWTVSDQWVTEQKIPTWAIILAVVLFFCIAFFSLLFLLAKETTYRAVVQVHVTSGPYQYVARIPAGDQTQVQYLYQQVNYVRSLATM
jgi:hypothetical protein